MPWPGLFCQLFSGQLAGGEAPCGPPCWECLEKARMYGLQMEISYDIMGYDIGNSIMFNMCIVYDKRIWWDYNRCFPAVFYICVYLCAHICIYIIIISLFIYIYTYVVFIIRRIIPRSKNTMGMWCNGIQCGTSSSFMVFNIWRPEWHNGECTNVMWNVGIYTK
jgi:hypothetical protein